MCMFAIVALASILFGSVASHKQDGALITRRTQTGSTDQDLMKKYLACIGKASQKLQTQITPCITSFGSSLGASGASLQTSQNPSSGTKTVLWAWSCNAKAASAFVGYGNCLCTVMGATGSGGYAYEAKKCISDFAPKGVADNMGQYDPVKMMGASVSMMVNMYCPGLDFACGGQAAVTMFKLRKLQIQFTINMETGKVIDYKAEIHLAVATTAGVEERYVTITYGTSGGRRLSTAATATIEKLPKTIASSAESKLKRNLVSSIQAKVPSASVSNVAVTNTEQKVTLEEMGVSAQKKATTSVAMPSHLLDQAFPLFLAMIVLSQ